MGLGETTRCVTEANAPVTRDCLVRHVYCGGIIGPYFFVNGDSARIMVHEETYPTIITDWFVYALHGIDVNDVWSFQFCKHGSISNRM